MSRRRRRQQQRGDDARLGEGRYHGDLPYPGFARECLECGTRLRPGQPHVGIRPYPHHTYAMLTCENPT